MFFEFWVLLQKQESNKVETQTSFLNKTKKILNSKKFLNINK